MSAWSRRAAVAAIAMFVWVASGSLAAQQDKKPETQAPAAKKNPLLKLVEPWPTPEKMKERKANAEALALFDSLDPLEVTLTGDFKAINKDHNPESKQRYPGTVKVGTEETAVQFAARGHVRRMARTCDYVPLKLEFPDKPATTSVFARQEKLKLVVQCAGGGEFEQFIYKEYLAYRIFSVLVPHQSFRARLAKVSYVDRASGKPAGNRVGIFLEDEGDVAKRMEGRVVELQRLLFENLDTDTLMPMMIFEYMIGNTDFSIYALHNVRIVQRPDKSLHPVPYDFDFSGLVNTPYAVPARGLMLKTVTDRYYRGPCKRQEQVDPYVANFVAKRDQIRALPESIPGIDRRTRDETKSYIDSFYSSIRSTKDVRGLFVSCSDKPTM